jgi:hypothetical protein
VARKGCAVETKIDEIAEDICRLSTFVPEIGQGSRRGVRFPDTDAPDREYHRDGDAATDTRRVGGRFFRRT